MYFYVSPFLAPGGGDTYEYMSPPIPSGAALSVCYKDASPGSGLSCVSVWDSC